MADILVTGATGFIGRHLVARLIEAGHTPVIFERSAAAHGDGPAMFADLERLAEIGLDAAQMPGRFDAVVHLAGLADVGGTGGRDAFMAANADLTGRLVDFAIGAGVPAFIHLSSILAVTGNSADRAVDDGTAPAPDSDYGVSKLAAEEHVARFAQTGRLGVSLRPPMVVGPGARGNWRRLVKLATTGMPLPLRSLTNRRSVVGIRTVCEAILHLIEGGFDADASGRYALANSPPASVRDMVRWVGTGAGRRVRLVPLPAVFLSAALTLTGRARTAASVIGELVVDSQRFEAVFGFVPSETTRDAVIDSVGAAADDERTMPDSAETAPPESRARVLLDQIVAALMLVPAIPVMLAVGLAIRLGSPGPAVFAQVRVGRSETPFRLYKFRTMHVGTPEAATHELGQGAVTRIGGILRRVKLDELPQLFNVLRGEMAFVGPRPCLPAQTDLIAERRRRGVFSVRPGITGKAQIAGIDMSRPRRLAEVDQQWLAERGLINDIGLMIRTALGAGRGDRVGGA